jgi:hypothetical protein
MRLEKHLRKVVGYCGSQRDKAIVGNAAYQEYDPNCYVVSGARFPSSQ